MGNIVIAKPNDAGALTASSEAVDMPASMLRTINRSDIWESTADSGQTLKVDFGVPVTVSFVGLFLTNLTGAATWAVKASNTPATVFSAPEFEIASSAFWLDPADDSARPSSFRFFAPQTKQAWGIELEDAANPDGVLQAARLVLADALQPAWNYQSGSGNAFIGRSRAEESEGGGAIVEGRDGDPAFDFVLDGLTEAEFFGKMDPIMRGGSAQDVALVTDPDAATYLYKKALWGRLQTRRATLLPNGKRRLPCRFVGL